MLPRLLYHQYAVAAAAWAEAFKAAAAARARPQAQSLDQGQRKLLIKKGILLKTCSRGKQTGI